MNAKIQIKSDKQKNAVKDSSQIKIESKNFKTKVCFQKFYLKRQTVRKDDTVPVMECITVDGTHT